MKRVVAFLLAAIVAVMLSGCGVSAPAAKGESSEAVTSSTGSEPQVSSEAVSSAPEVSSQAVSSQASSENKRMSYGSDLLGYVTLQDYWAINMDYFGEPDVVQYTEENSSITLKVYKDAAMSAKKYADGINELMVQEGALDVVTEKVTLAGFDAYLTHCRYTDHYALYEWFFETGNGNVNYVAAEAMETDIDAVKAMIQSSYTISAGNTSAVKSGSESKITPQRVGSEKTGYVNIPDDWSLDPDGEAVPGMMMYVSKDGTAMMSLMNADIAAEQYKDSSFASLMMGGSETRVSTIMMDGNAAMRFTTQKGQDGSAVQWAIYTGSTETISILLFVPNDMKDALIQLFEESFSMKK